MGLYIRGNVWWFRFRLRGREVRESTGLAATNENKTLALAKEAESRLDWMASRRGVNRVTSVLFRDAAEEFLEWCDSTEYRRRPSTAQRIRTSFASLTEFLGAQNVHEIEAYEIEKYKTWRGQVHRVRDVTIRHDLHALSVFFQWAAKAGCAISNPVRQVSIPSDIDAVRIHVISREEEAAYFEQAATVSSNLHDLAKLILLQGARPDELLSSKKSSFDAAAGSLLIPGGKTRASRRTLALTREAFEIVRRRAKAPNSSWLFPSTRRPGEHLTKLNAQHDEACRLAGVSFCLDDLRHTFATRLLTESGADIGTVAAIMGHQGLHVIQRYIHPTAASQKAAMEAYQRSIDAHKKRAQSGRRRA